MGKSINKESLLFFGVGFHQYNNYLVDYLSRKYELCHYGTGEFKKDHRFFMCWARYFPTIVRDKYRLCLTNYIKLTQDRHFDYVLVLKGTYFQDNHIELLKRLHPESKFVLYLWDSLKNMENADVLRRHFKTIFSFDTVDCRRYDFKLRPLFYLDSNKTQCRKFDISFIGNAHSDRLERLQELKSFCKANSISYKFVIPVGGSVYLKAKYCKNHLLHNDIDIIRKDSISYPEYLEITKCSKIVVDIPSPHQSGLSIRTIESLAYGVRVITTNKHITEYDNIPSDMYYVWDYKYDKKLLDFITSSQKREYTIDSYFSIDSFIEELLS